MKKETLINNELFTDYKAVARAADLIERGIIDPERIEIVPTGAQKRAYAKDIEQVVQYHSDYRRQDRIRIEVNREGLYDMLPEGLFHRPPRGSSGMDEDGMIKDVRERREEEKKARLFFSPFDAEINHLRMMTELYENRLDKRTTYTDLNRVFELGWEEFRLLNKEQSIIWMHLLPEIQQKRNDTDFVAHVLSALFNIPFEIRNTTDEIKPAAVDADLQMQLGRGSLGIDTIIGSHFQPDNEQITIAIGPAVAEDLIDFLPGKHNRKIMDMALEYLIPMETDICIDMQTDTRFQESILSADGANVYLGYTVYV
ncbi:type VI secretion system baseplate subunit TssG [Pedobacter duraquae]|uniref:Type VI secretion system (T6SS) VasB/ImpH family protein n=1 Tax=Pedobacter duraquae TaxID=425511 RepID=A0A4R6ISG8_9SPHI|nr:type VI secretion system baseplate subunit TssG [Pedobacter duraquae]TDO24916.1 type VI secretion system (T6SS) VasB/ImpH family protein [Pedobacter duraquae]